MFKRLVLLPLSIAVVSCVSLVSAPLERIEPIDLTYDAIQVLEVTTTSTSTTTTTIEVAPPPVPTTTIPQGDWKCPQWLGLATDIGWPTEELPMLDRVLWKESRCNVDSHNPSDPMGGSYGLMQVNGFWCSPTQYNPNGWLQGKGILSVCTDLYDPAINLQAALAIWQRSGWSPW